MYVHAYLFADWMTAALGMSWLSCCIEVVAEWHSSLLTCVVV